MDRKHRDILRRNRVFLTQNLMVDSLLPYLAAYGVFTDDMIDIIRSKGAEFHQKQQLLTDLTRRGPHAFGLFINCLVDSDQGFIADRLRTEDSGREVPPRVPAPAHGPVIQQAHFQNPCASPVQVQASTEMNNFPPQSVPMDTSAGHLVQHPVSDVQSQTKIPDRIDETISKQRDRSNVQETHVKQEAGCPENIDERVFTSPSQGGNNASAFVAVPSTVPADPAKVYQTWAKPHGCCLIFNNKHFQLPLKDRDGTDIDRDNLVMLFRETLGYQVECREDLSSKDIIMETQNFADMTQHSHSDSVVLAYLTHGETNNQIFGSDSKPVSLLELLEMFDGHNCHHLKGKPKLFMVQACRGSSMDNGYDVTDTLPTNTERCFDRSSQIISGLSSLQMNIREVENLKQNPKLPTMTDMLIAYATIPGYVSWRNSEKGSWFVQAIVDVFTKQSGQEDVLSMMTMVNDKVATRFESTSAGYRQSPAPVTTLRKKWYFHYQ